MNYRQLNAEERSALAALRSVGVSKAEIARELGRHRSTVGRELKRNAAPHDGRYRSGRAHQRAHARRYRSRRNSQFGREEWARVEELLRQEWSPEQVSGHLARSGELAISHESIYRHVWRDLKAGGTLHVHLRCARKQCRKRYGRHDSRGRLAGKRMIGERPAVVGRRSRIGDWEIDTVMGESLGESSDCILTLVERKTGYVLIGKMKARTAAEANRALLELMARHPGRVKTITADNGTEPSGARQPAEGSPQGSAGGRWQNRIKEQQLDMFADRTSTAFLSSNQLRLWFSTFAYLLLGQVRAVALSGTRLAQATVGTIRLHLLKIAAQVTVSVRRIHVRLCSACPMREEFAHAHGQLRAYSG